MIYSKVRTQEELQEHMAYLGEKYVKYWALWTQGFHVIPVIGKKSIERLFEINIQDKTMCGMMPYPDSGFEPACPIAGVVYNKEQLMKIGVKYSLTLRQDYLNSATL